MNRIIKFRAKVKYPKDKVILGNLEPEGTWVTGDLHLESNVPHIHTSKVNKQPIDPDIVGQFTGLHDKNYKELYEGDIIKTTNGSIGYITFLLQAMGYVIVWEKSDSRLGHRSRGGGYQMDPSIEIIGNIYDNKDLITWLK